MIFAARRATTARPWRMRPPPCSGAPGEAWKQRTYLLQQGFWPVGGPGDWGGVGGGGQRTELKVVLRARRAKGVADGSAVVPAPGERRRSRVCVDCVVHLSISMELEENANCYGWRYGC